MKTGLTNGFQLPYFVSAVLVLVLYHACDIHVPFLTIRLNVTFHHLLTNLLCEWMSEFALVSM